MKGQISTFIKIISVVISVVMFVFIVYQYQNYKSQVIKEKESSQFRIEVLNTLQKLVSDESCLAYSDSNTSFKPVLDKAKIDEFAEKYKDLEPECAKALEFDYNIEITQLEKKLQTYPGEIIIEGECGPANAIAVHSVEDAYYFSCDKDLADPEISESCCNDRELDGTFPRSIMCEGGEVVNCAPYDCSNFLKSNEECEYIDETTDEKACCLREACKPAHPWFMECFNINAEEDCTKITFSGHAWCGNAGTSKKIPGGESIDISISQETWGFAISSGMSSFSPDKARGEEIELSIPVVIRYDEKVSTDGVLNIKAVKGELESFYGIINDVCEKAMENKEMIFSQYFKFSYPVTNVGNMVCMLDSCKIFDCPLNLVFDGIDSGEYVLEISSDLENNEIRVEK